MKPITLIDLHGQYLQLKDELDSAILKTARSGYYINDATVDRFSIELAKYLKVPFVITCANGTDAIQIALMALNLNPSDEIITSNYSFIAAAEAIALLKLTPVFVDVDEKTFTIDTTKIRLAITSKTRAIIPVHLFGQSSNMNEIMAIAKEFNLYVIEDAAQSLGGSYTINGNSKKLGTIGDIGCTSFFPSKNLGCFGDGGAMFTNNETLATRIKQICNHGSNKKFYHETIGLNSRLDAIQAAILSVKLKMLDEWNNKRRAIADKYDNKLSHCPELTIPYRDPNAHHVFNQYTILLKNKSNVDLKTFLQSKDIPSAIYYPITLHQQPVFSHLDSSTKSFPVSESLRKSVLSLPMHPDVDDDQIDYISSAIISYLMP